MTAGNRGLWSGCNVDVSQVVFLDRELKLKTPPDVFADHRYLPFRDDVFEVAIYDPPFMARRNPPQKWNDPTEAEYVNNRGFVASNKWWGMPKTTSELWGTIHRAQQELNRVTGRICLKWGEIDYTLWKVLPFFKNWREIHRQGFKQSRHPTKGYQWKLRASSDKDCKTWWITFVKN